MVMTPATIKIPFEMGGEGAPEKLPQLTILYKGVFIPKALYWIAREWFMERTYRDLTNDRNLFFVERLYAERRLETRDYRMWWRIWREPYYPPATSSYFRWFVDLDWRCVGVSDIELVHEGRKIRAFQGEVRIQISAKIVWDYNGEWRKHWFLRNIEAFFRRRMYKQELESSRKQLYREVYRFYSMMKKYLEIKTFVSEFDTFHEKYEIT